MLLMRWMNAGVAILFLVFLWLLYVDPHLTFDIKDAQGLFIVTAPPVLLILNFSFRKAHTALAIFWGFSWTAVWLYETLIASFIILGFPWLYAGRPDLEWFLYVTLAAAAINFVSISVLIFFPEIRTHVPRVRSSTD